MKKVRLFLVGALVVVIGLLSDAQTNDQVLSGAPRAEGIARSALPDCISGAARYYEILYTAFPGENEGDWYVRICGDRRGFSIPNQRIGWVQIRNWEVVDSRCEFPAPTSNPC